MPKVATLLAIQEGRCFYCRQTLSVEDATIEHIVPKSTGGPSDISNTAAVCAAVNHGFGAAPVKLKLDVLLGSSRGFQCPAKSSCSVSLIPQAAVKKQSGSVKQRLAADLAAAYQAVAEHYDGRCAHLGALGLELRRRIPNFKQKAYGYKLLGQLVNSMGYIVEGQWARKSLENTSR